MLYQNLNELSGSIKGVLALEGEKIKVTDSDKFTREVIDQLVYSAVFGNAEIKEVCRWIIWEASPVLGIYPSSIQGI